MSIVFSPLSLKDKELVMPHLTSSRFIDTGFSSLYSITDNFKPEYAFFKNRLLIRIFYDHHYVYFHPFGNPSAEDLLEIICALGAEGPLLFDFVPEKALPLYQSLQGFSATASFEEKYSDFFTDFESFTDTNRAGHPRKYTDYRSFVTHYSPTLIEMNTNNASIAKTLMDEWCSKRDCSLCAYGCEKLLLNRIIENYDALPVKGFLVQIDGKYVAYLIGEQNGDTALILYGKPVGKQNGLNVFLHIELIKQLFPNCSYVNFSPDSGMPGLSLFKQKFKPYQKLNKYLITLKQS